MPRLSLTTLFGVDPTTDDKHHFETSWVLPPAILASLRGLISLYIFTSIFVFWSWYGTYNDHASIGHSFSLADLLGYWLLHAIRCDPYSLLCTNGSLSSPRPLGTGLPHITQPVVCDNHDVPVSRYGYLLGCTVHSTVVQSTFTGWQNISQHCLNSVYALLKIILPATAPHPFIAIPFLILMLLLYLCIAYITHETEGWYPYSFLDVGDHGQKSKRVMGYCFGILGAVRVVFLVSWALINLRRRLTHGKIRRARRDPLCAHDAFVRACGGEQSNEIKGVPV